MPSASGLAAGSLAGLTRLTLAFALLLAAASTALVLVAGAVQRRRSLTVLAVIGATLRQRGAFLWAEARWTVLAGITGGLLSGTLIALQLVTILKWIFDPPPQHPAVPWSFLLFLLGGVLLAATAATLLCISWARRLDPALLREG